MKMKAEDWPIGFRFRYNSPYNENNEYDRVVARVNNGNKITPEFYSKNRSNEYSGSNFSITSTKSVVFKLCEIDIELPGEYIKKDRNKKLKKLGIK